MSRSDSHHTKSSTKPSKRRTDRDDSSSQRKLKSTAVDLEPKSDPKSKKSKDKKKRKEKHKGASNEEQNTMESSPPPYQPEEHEHLTQEQRKAIEVSLQPEALAAERNAQMNLLNGLMDASGEITIKPKVKTASQAAEVTVSTPAGDGSKNEESASKVEPESIQPAKKKARLALLERSKQLAQQNAKSDAWQPNQRYVPPTEVSQTTTADADASSSSEGESESESEEKPSSKGQGDGVKMSQLTEMFKPHEAEAGFSLGDMLDGAELDEDEYDPFAAFKPAEPQEQPVYHRAPLFSAPSTIRPTEQSQTKPSEAPLFLPFVLEDDQTQELIKEMHLTPAQVSQLEARSWTTGTGRRFTQLGSREDMIKQFEEVRPQITEQVRKRHREAVRKKQRRRG